jgi:hypothetical protein
MNRRSFLAGAVSTGTLSVKSSGTEQIKPQPPERLPVPPRAKWIENGVIDAGGSHEPYLFVVRRGGQRLDARERCDLNQREALIRRLKSQGVEIFHTHLYKGFGMAAELSEMRDTARAARIAHSLGMRVDTYIQWNTLMYETFFVEEPRAKEWIQRDALGRPILLSYGYQQSFRYRPCFANSEYLAYIQKILRFALQEVKTDFIHFDNFDLNSEPDSCHCDACVNGFRARLRSKYSAAQRKERFGFDVVDYVIPPLWNADNPPSRLKVISDPVLQEWIDFRCQMMADALTKMALYAKSMNPEVVVEVNPHGITGGNRAWEAGIDHARILKSTQVFWTEEQNVPGMLPDGRLLSKIRSYKLARAYRNTVLTYLPSELAVAECLAFNQTTGFAGSDPLGSEMQRYIDFYHRHRECYTGTRDVASVAVLRSYASITYNHARAQLAAILTEQVLIQSRIPFDLVFDEHLADLSKYRVLVLPESECLSDSELESIRRFVTAGGGLVAIGQAGLFDQWRRLRVRPGLEGLVDRQPLARMNELSEPADDAGRSWDTASRREFAEGRTAYLPELLLDGVRPPASAFFNIGPQFWKFPKNGSELLEAVLWAARIELPVQVSGPPSLIANLVKQPERNLLCLHLVNYESKASTIENVDVRLRLPRGVTASQVKLISPDTDGSQTLSARMEGMELVFRVPDVHQYSVAVVNCQRLA